MKLGFRFIDEPEPGPQWSTLYSELWPGYQRWFLRAGLGARETYLAGMKALRGHMPELVVVYERLCELAGGRDLPARFLSAWSPPAYVSGCSQLAIDTTEGPILIRNYDYAPHLCEGTFVCSSWLGRKVIASQDCLWGVLDGMNEDGLAVSLTFGGRQLVGRGFGAPLILRYVLETCASTREAAEAIGSVPSHMAYNFTILDRAGDVQTLFVAPGERPVSRRQHYAVNHQDDLSWKDYLDFSRSFDRERVLQTMLRNGGLRTPGELFGAFGSRYLFSTAYHRGFGTLYTSAYLPGSGRAYYVWPELTIEQSFDGFTERRFSRSFEVARPGSETQPVYRPTELLFQ